jgi:hypothetical protein
VTAPRSAAAERIVFMDVMMRKLTRRSPPAHAPTPGVKGWEIQRAHPMLLR